MTPATHLIANDLGEPGGQGDAWLTGDDGVDAEIRAGLDQRLAAEVLMDEIDDAKI